jgi:hypothetical protein
MGEAQLFLKNILNPQHQLELLPQVIALPKSQRNTSGFRELSNCMICCAYIPHFEQTPCCGNFLCIDCLMTTMETAILDVAFHGVKCPFCNEHFSLEYIRWLMVERYDSYPLSEWRKVTLHSKYTNLWSYKGIYADNLYYKLTSLLTTIENLRRPFKLNPSEPNGMAKLLEGDEYYGACSGCTPPINRNRKRRNYGHLQICSVEKQCANAENGLVVLRPEMFRCMVCKSYDDDYNDGVFKKCPHCGIKTVKPEGCNYVRCGNHRWCFVCNERLPNNHDGHNTHYYTGPGTGPYSARCRVTMKSSKPTFVLNSCACSECQPNHGAPLCRETECMNRTTSTQCGTMFNVYCDACNNPEQSMLKYYEGFHRDVVLIEYYT